MAEEKINTDVREDIDEVAKYDPELRFRKVSDIAARFVFVMTIILSLFHIYTAGFGVLQEWRHRAFHLAFVLPLVFFLYTIHKGGRKEEKKFLFYDFSYGLTGGVVTGVIFKEILALPFSAAVSLAAVVGVLLVYFKRRDFISHRAALYADVCLFTLMIAGFVYGAVIEFNDLHFLTWFKDLNFSLVFWGVFLLGTFLGIIALFIVQWILALKRILSGASAVFREGEIPYFDLFFAILSSLISVYIFLEFNNIGERAGLPVQSDLILGGFAFLMVLEAARRSIGPPLPIIALIVLANCYLGPYFLDIPGLDLFAHRGYSVSRIIDYMYLGTEGIYGIPLGVVATFVFHFVLFGLFIARTGLGQLFMDLAMAIAGGTSGGPAKVAVISSGFFGSISGSSVANTVTTGSFTIPLMRKVGYSPVFAGAVEAAASTGGQIMPPVMGAAAFIMAEFLGIPYIKIATCAIVPALLYYFAVGTMVHLEAVKNGLFGLPRHMLPRVLTVLKERGLLVAPLIIIVYLLISGKSPFLAAFWGIILSVSIGQVHKRTLPLLISILLTIPSILFEISPFDQTIHAAVWVIFMAGGSALLFRRSGRLIFLLGIFTSLLFVALVSYGLEPSLSAFWTNLAIIGVGVFYPESKMRVPDILSALEWGTRNALAIGAACACVGFIVGATTLTGLGLKFAATVISLAHGVATFIGHIDVMHLFTVDGTTLFFTLVFTAVACFILGMGIPTTAQYIVASMIAAPALLQWGIHPLVSHMFVFYYSILADVTPPVALAAYAASGISGANPFRTGLRAFTLSSAGFIAPFIFVSAPIVLWFPTIIDGTTPFDFVWFIQVLITLVLGVIALAATVIGYLSDRSTILERILTASSAALLIFPETYTDIIGALILGAVFLIQRKRKKRISESKTQQEIPMEDSIIMD
jgi:TRAP-type uncharacterized transport system fused permease subunit